jgi:hypothetical protein
MVSSSLQELPMERSTTFKEKVMILGANQLKLAMMEELTR